MLLLNMLRACRASSSCTTRSPIVSGMAQSVNFTEIPVLMKTWRFMSREWVVWAGSFGGVHCCCIHGDIGNVSAFNGRL
jgi:hypothetical protein